ncbi:hypothetical protein C8Q80DRAFT_1355856 [Daedaleopsis nitida]|nr:hypothetical protein C8Q80DRAFT_1355856 [Daedaleopsis nitida]
MPLDVLLEIFALLHPRDLLCLARTTRDFRAFLMSRERSIFLWRTARKAIKGLPEPPPPLSEPAGGRYETGYHKAEIDEILRLWKNAQKARTATKKEFVKQRYTFVSECFKLAKQLAKWEEGAVQKERAHKQATKEALKEEHFADVLVKLRDEGWDDELTKMGEQARERLFELAVTRAAKLTQKGWDTMRASLIEHMESVRAQRLHREYLAMIKARVRLLKRVFYTYARREVKRSKNVIVCATVIDCAYIPEIRAILEDESPGCTEESIMAQFVDTVPASVAKWNKDRKADLAALAVKAFGDSDAARAPQPLDLAVALFRCQRCSNDGITLRYSDMLKHACVRYLPSPSKGRFHEALELALRNEGALNPKEYRNVNTSLMQQGVRWAHDIIEACGHDPDRVTFEEMEACEARLRCCICATLSIQKLYSWQLAIERTLQHHRTFGAEQLTGFWERVPEEYAATARSLESALEGKTVPETEARFEFEDAMCMRCCHYSIVKWIKMHLKDEHGMQKPQLDNDYRLRKKSRKEITMYAELYSKIPSKEAAVTNGEAFFASF